MGVVEFLDHPDTVLTTSDLGTLADGLFAEISIPGATPHHLTRELRQHPQRVARRTSGDNPR